MKIDVTQVLIDYEGKELKSKDKPYTLRDALAIALNSNLPNELQTAEDKNKSYQLSRKIYDNKEVDLTLDDRSFLKEKAGKYLNILVQGRVWDILEDKPEPKKAN